MENNNIALSQMKIKQEPGISIKQEPKTERLSSFRLPRDLTLGGLGNGRTTKPNLNKKVYTPNLNAVRNKNVDVKTASNSTSKGKTRNERNNKNDKFPNKKSSLIQTSGIFSEGMATKTLMRSSSRYDKYSSGKESGSEVMKRPTLKMEIKIDPDEENKRIMDILKEEDEEKYSSADNYTNMPVSLDNYDIKVKLEPDTPIKTEANFNNVTLDTIDALMKDNQNFFLMQLPDALPGRSLEEEKPAEGKNEGEEVTPDNCTINQLEDGFIGRVVRHKSGKVKLILGNMKFDITSGMDSGFLQELVSISAKAEERSGNIINLSTVKAKLNASPDWEYLFKNSK